MENQEPKVEEKKVEEQKVYTAAEKAQMLEDEEDEYFE